MTWITSNHHVLGVKELLGQFGDCDCTKPLGPSAREGGKPRHKEVEAWKRDEVYGKFSEVRV